MGYLFATVKIQIHLLVPQCKVLEAFYKAVPPLLLPLIYVKLCSVCEALSFALLHSEIQTLKRTVSSPPAATLNLACQNTSSSSATTTTTSSADPNSVVCGQVVYATLIFEWVIENKTKTKRRIKQLQCAWAFLGGLWQNELNLVLPSASYR